MTTDTRDHSGTAVRRNRRGVLQRLEDAKRCGVGYPDGTYDGASIDLGRHAFAPHDLPHPETRTDLERVSCGIVRVLKATTSGRPALRGHAMGAEGCV